MTSHPTGSDRATPGGSQPAPHRRSFAAHVAAFAAHPPLAERVLQVANSLPPEVQDDFLEDPTFQISLEQITRSRSSTMFMACPTGRNVSRCVILRKKLATAPTGFALYVIAHELAHAYLRNGAWGEISDREAAADALAASWGFSRP